MIVDPDDLDRVDLVFTGGVTGASDLTLVIMGKGPGTSGIICFLCCKLLDFLVTLQGGAVVGGMTTGG